MKISTMTITAQNDLTYRPINKAKKAFLNENNLTIKSLGKYLTNSSETRRFSETFYHSFEQKRRPRLVKKNGELNIDMENVPKRKRRLLRDLFNTILDMKWRWHSVIYILSFVLSWVIFGVIWYGIAYAHGDIINYDADNSSMETHNLSINLNLSQQIKNLNDLIRHLNRTNNNSVDLAEYINKNFKLPTTLSVSYLDDDKEEDNHQRLPCVQHLHDFSSAILFSVETQQTIGYGFRHITEECPQAVILLMIQSCFGLFMQSFVAGVVFAKISRPNKRKRTIIFSHNAVVSERDGKLCFMFKIGNIKISQLSDASVKIHMIKSRRTSEGEFIPFQSYDMKVGEDWSGNDSVFFPWPKTVEHIIDENSPMYEICKSYIEHKNENSKKDTKRDDESSSVNSIKTINDSLQHNLDKKKIDYEIVVMLEGNIETTGASCHIRTSYLPQEILFGYRFTPIYPKFTNSEYLFDYSKFDQVEPFQYDLMNLNTNHLNGQSVYDTKHEDKNYQLTCQNTVHHNSFNLNGKKDTKHKDDSSRALSTILSTFKSNSAINSSIQGESRLITTPPVTQINNDISQASFSSPNVSSSVDDFSEIKSKSKLKPNYSAGRFTIYRVESNLSEI